MSDERMQQQVAGFLTTIVRGVFLMQPQHIEIHPYKHGLLFLRATFKKPGSTKKEEKTVQKCVVLHNTPNFQFTPASIPEAFESEEWPPVKMIEEIERRILVASVEKPKLILPK